VTELNDATRPNWVVVITDGLPNCNAMNPNTCTSPTLCKCTLNSGSCGTVVNDTDPNNFCRRGCLDQNGAIQAVTDLRGKNIRTVVIGFGSDLSTSGDAFGVLNGMASVGGYVRRCPNGNECGAGNTCMMPSHTCAQAFYQAQTAGELATALTDVTATISGP
jgi:hypothetical protein